MATDYEVTDAALAMLATAQEADIAKWGTDSELSELDLEYPDWRVVENLFEDNYMIDYRPPFIVNGLTFTLEDQHGGQGQGDEYWFVLKVESASGTQYFKLDGWYSSYEGSNFEDSVPVEVKPIEVVKREWENL